MVNTSNYFDTIKQIGLTNLPESLQKGHDYIVKATENNDNWNAYNNGDATRRVIDVIFSKVDEFMKSRGGSSIAPVQRETSSNTAAKKERAPKEVHPARRREKKEKVNRVSPEDAGVE